MSAVISMGAASLEHAGLAEASMQVNACGVADAGGANNIFGPVGTFGIQTSDLCSSGQGLILQQDSVNKVAYGAASAWVAATPPGLVIVNANVPSMNTLGVVGTGYVANFYWNNGGPPARVGNLQSSFSTALPSSTVFGFSLGCASAHGGPCRPSPASDILVKDVQLTVVETGPPWVTALYSNNLWYQGSVGNPAGTRWVYGSWPISFTATAPSGICAYGASLNGVSVPNAPGWAPDPTVWQQCPNGQQWPSAYVNVSGNGPQTLDLAATSAAGNTTTATETIHVDSVRPTITLSGPTDASSAAGTQYITATATAGASGVQGISCGLDGAPAQWHVGSSVAIPVSGVGVHDLQCRAANNSYSSTGQVNWSTNASWSLSIRQPSVSAATFSRIVDTLKCGKVRKRERLPAHWVTVRRRGKLVHVKRRGTTVVRRVVRCHPRVVVKRVCHARHCTRERIVVLPHTEQLSTWRARFGKGATVSGWLGTSSGAPLPSQQVQILTAPDNGSNAFSPAAVVTTGANGTWSADLPSGPSRLVEAVYGGATTIEPATSGQIHLVVPAKVKLTVRPRRVRWGGTIRIAGRVLGGYIPAGKLLRLRIGVSGIRETVGIPNIQPNGRFHTTWTFAAGSGVVHYWFSVSTLNEADYPYAPGSSRRVYVRVGP